MASNDMWKRVEGAALVLLRALGLADSGQADAQEAREPPKKPSFKKSIELALQSEQRMAMPQLDRWSRMLKALQVAPQALMPALERELDRGLDQEEMLIAIPKEGMFFDGLMVGKKIDALEYFCSVLDQEAVKTRVMGKIPSLRDWALGNLAEGALLRKNNADTLAWARTTGRLRPALKEALFAEAIEDGRGELARRELQDAGLDKLGAGEMDKYMTAFAERKEAGLSSGLDSDGLDAFAQSMGGWGELAQAAADLGFEKLMDFVEHLMNAVAEESLLEEKVLAKAKATSTKRVRELISTAMAAQAAKNDRPIALQAAIAARADAMGVSQEKAAMSPVQQARIKVGQMEVPLAIAGGVGLFEIAKLSGAAGAQQAMGAVAPKSTKIDSQRMGELVQATEKNVRAVVMRASGEERLATKAWRETVKEWKQGVLGDVSMSQMQEIVRKQVAQAGQEPAVDGQAAPARRPKGP
jgi:hypothetical protein